MVVTQPALSVTVRLYTQRRPAASLDVTPKVELLEVSAVEAVQVVGRTSSLSGSTEGSSSP